MYGSQFSSCEGASVFDWLFEGRTSVYVLLGVAAVGLLYLGNQGKRRALLAAGAIAAALIGLYFVLDRVVETDREQVKRQLFEMAEEVKTGNTDRIISHLSPKFSVWGMDRSAFRGYVDSRLSGRLIEELAIWDVAFPDGGTPAADGSLRVTFNAKPKAARLGTTPHFLCEATFLRDTDGPWRMTGFKIFNPPPLDGKTPIERP